MNEVDARTLPRLVAELIGSHATAAWIPNLGNAGDALICAGAWQLFDRAGVARRIVAAQPGQRAGVYIYPGGGNLVPEYDRARRAIESRLHEPFERFIVLPHTIRGHADLLARLDQRFHLFCRERASYEYVRSQAPRAQVYLSEDLALALDVPRLLRRDRQLLNIARIAAHPRLLRRYLQWRRRLTLIRGDDRHLRLMRVDVEAGGGAAGRDPSQDLSAGYVSEFSMRAEADLVSSDFMRVLQRARSVETDRLHVAIGASLLNKHVRMRDNSYGKNKAVYEYSMKQRFANAALVVE